MALPTHLNPSLTARSATVATDCDPSNACCLSNDEGQSKTAASTYETVKPGPSFWKETAVRVAHILVGGPLFGCGGGVRIFVPHTLLSVGKGAVSYPSAGSFVMQMPLYVISHLPIVRSLPVALRQVFVKRKVP